MQIGAPLPGEKGIPHFIIMPGHIESFEVVMEVGTYDLLRITSQPPGVAQVLNSRS